jgi:hypothetical protein
VGALAAEQRVSIVLDGSEQRVSVSSGSPGTTAGGTMFTYARSKEMITEEVLRSF